MHQIVFVAIGLVIVLFIILTFVVAMNFSKNAGLSQDDDHEQRRAIRIALQKEHAKLTEQHQSGQLSSQEFEHKERVLAQRLLDEGGLPPEKHKPRQERGLIKMTAFALTILFPLTGAGLYLFYGDFSSLETNAVAQIEATRNAVKSEKTMAGVITQLENAVQKDANNLSAWEILAEHYSQTNNIAQAEIAYENIVRLDPKNAKALAELIDIKVGMNGGAMEGDVPELVQKAMKLDPFEPKILLLAGFIDYQKGNYKQAVIYWNRLRAQMPANDDMLQMISKNIEMAMKAGHMDKLPEDKLLNEFMAQQAKEKATPKK